MIDPTASIDPWARVEDATVGPLSVIRQFASVTGGAILGAACSVSPFAMLHGPKFGDRCVISGGVKMGPGFLIGDDCFIGPNVTFCNDAWPIADKTGFNVEALRGGAWAVIMEAGASVGAGAIVLPGVSIGARAMIGAGSVVDRDVPAGCLFERDGSIRPYPERVVRRRMRAA